MYHRLNSFGYEHDEVLDVCNETSVERKVHDGGPRFTGHAGHRSVVQQFTREIIAKITRYQL